MSHSLSIHNFGPIKDCQCKIDQFTIFTGPQSSGKSTVAKAIFFFRTIKTDILELLKQGSPKIITDSNTATWNYAIQQRLRNKFLELFGTSWIMPVDMQLEYRYSDCANIKVYLESGYEDRNFVRFAFSQDILDYISELENRSFLNMMPGQLQTEEKQLCKLFDDPYETVFIPAGRNLITLLSTQLNYIFTSLEGSQLRNIDFITKRYIELILKLKPLFSDGIRGLMDTAMDQPEQLKKIKPNKAAINRLIARSEKILRGYYRYVEGEERVYLDSRKYIKINFSSSGQQEIVWVINLLFYYLFENKRVFLIIEEPESHLFPDSQQSIGELLSLFATCKNQVLVTTHSPYLLGTFNYLLLASQAGSFAAETAKDQVDKGYWLPADKAAAYFIHDGEMNPAMDVEDNISLIINELIDGASREINGKSEALLELLYREAADEHQ